MAPLPLLHAPARHTCLTPVWPALTPFKSVNNWLGHSGPDFLKLDINYDSSLEKLSDTSIEQDNVIAATTAGIQVV